MWEKYVYGSDSHHAYTRLRSTYGIRIRKSTAYVAIVKYAYT